MSKRKRRKGQTMIYKPLFIKLKIEQKNGGWTQVLRKDRQFLLHARINSFFPIFAFTAMRKSLCKTL
jgi:hypothetical protein